MEMTVSPANVPSLAVLIGELVDFLSQDPLTVDDVVGLVGPVVNDPGVPSPMDLQSHLDGIVLARLARYPDSGLPYVLTVGPDPGLRITPTQLVATLGDFRPANTHRGLPPAVVYSAPSPGRRWRVVVTAQVQPDGGVLQDGQITSVALRRDPQTPETTA